MHYQTDEAQETGYEESEIVSSVIRAIIPSLILRNVLQRRANLSLNKLLSEESPKESEYQYSMRCIETRQKVMLAFNKSDVKYDKELARKLFYFSRETELLSSYVIQEI